MPADATRQTDGARCSCRSPGSRLAVLPLIVLIRAYQLLFSPWLGTACRFQPTCSHYGIEALERWGAVRGCRLTLRRILRCRPGGGSGYDPVPKPLDHCE